MSRKLMPMKKNPSTDGNQNISGFEVHTSKKNLEHIVSQNFYVNTETIYMAHPIGNVKEPSTAHHTQVSSLPFVVVQAKSAYSWGVTASPGALFPRVCQHKEQK
jgi:hypothetical protein